MRRATLRQLQIFSSVARHRNFTRAAEELFLTQSSVSSQLKQLAEFVGHPLVEQVGKKITITAVGERIAILYDQLDRNWRECEDDISMLASPSKGSIRVAGVHTCQYFLPRVLGSFYQRYPDIEVSLRVFNREQVLDRIASNADDLYVIGHISEDLDMKALPFIDNPLIFVAHPAHPLAQKKSLAIKSLVNNKLLVREPGSGTRREIDRFLNEHGEYFPSQIELGSNEAIKQGIIGGLGISVLSVYATALELKLGLLVALDVKGFPLVRRWNIAYRSGKAITPVMRTFIDFLREEGRRLASENLDIAPLKKIPVEAATPNIS